MATTAAQLTNFTLAAALLDGVARFARGLVLFTTKITKCTKLIEPAYRAAVIVLKDRKARNHRNRSLMELNPSHGAAAQPRSSVGFVGMGIWPVRGGAPGPSRKPRSGVGKPITPHQPASLRDLRTGGAPLVDGLRPDCIGASPIPTKPALLRS
jgi:hypothetical protein